ncbi:MAG: hypothetical protein ACYCOO_01510 [Chitinophagaceae bacterium]
MKKQLLFALALGLGVVTAQAQSVKVSAAAKAALAKNYPQSAQNHITWEKENGNFEANWGGSDGEANSIQYSPSGKFVVGEVAIPASQLPSSALAYAHQKGAHESMGTKITKANGQVSYEMEWKGKSLVFNENGKYLRTENGD